MIEEAVRYAEVGLRVFPVAGVDEEGKCMCYLPSCGNAGKHPLNGAGGFRKATTDLQQITVWWKRHPQANIGYATGVPYLVVDIDGDQGEQSWRGIAPPGITTLEVGTGSGGRHLYFRLPDGGMDLTGRVNAKLAPGIDVRAGNGYVLLPPSRHRSGKRYTWKSRSGALLLPAWLYHLVRKERHVTPRSEAHINLTDTTRYGEVVLAACAERVKYAAQGDRNNTLAREAFIVGQYIAGGEIRAAGVDDYLADLCTDPDRRKTMQTVRGQLRNGAMYPKAAQRNGHAA